MILEGIVGVIATLLSDLIALLPAGTSGADLSGLATVVGDAKGFNAHLPITESLAALGVCVVYFNASMLYRAGNWVYRHIPFVG